MALPFGKKKKAEAAAQSDAPKVKRHTETMASVLQESVVETMLGYFRNNSAFVVIHEGRTYYVGLYFDTDTIGGLSKKSSKDEAKGQLIESLNSGHIAALITGELLAMESMVLIPTEATLEAMSEYEILRNLKFPLCYVSSDGQDIEITGVSVTVDQCMDIQKLGGSIEGYLEDTPPGASSEEFEPAEDETQGTFVGREEPEQEDESVPDDDAGSGFSEDSRHSVDMQRLDVPQAEEPDDGLPFGPDDFDGDDGYEGLVGEEPAYADYDDRQDDEESDWQEPQEEEDYVENVDSDDFDRVLRRKLYSDELGLEITTEPFDSQFMHGNEFVAFPEDRPDGWLNEQLNQMSKAANVELRQLHRDNLTRCRAQYFTLVSMFCDEISKILDYTDGSTQFGKIYIDLLNQHQESVENIGLRIAEKKRTLEDDYEARVRNAADAASVQAAQEYRERHGRQHSDALYNIESTCREDLEDEKEDAIRRMNDMRRAEAAKRLDMGVTSALKEVTEMYLKCLDEEKAVYAEKQREMEQFLNDNREHEIARVNTLKEELAQSDRANAVMAEYAARMQALRDQFDTQSKMMDAQIQRIERERQAELDSMKRQHMDELQALKDKLSTSEGEAADLRSQIIHMDEIKDKQYESRLEELAGEREAFSRKYEHLADMQKKTGAIIIVAAVVGIIAALAVGFAAGMFATRGEDAGFQNIQLPDGYVLIQNEDGSASVVRDPDTNEEIPYELPDESIPQASTDDEASQQPQTNDNQSDAGQEAGQNN